jgi:hypothetical protein
MAKLVFPGIVEFLPSDRPEVVSSARHSTEVSIIGTILGQCAEHTDVLIQAQLLEEVKVRRERLAAHLRGVDDAIEYIADQIAAQSNLSQSSSGRRASR